MNSTNTALAHLLDRRGFLSHAGSGLMGVSLAHLLAGELKGEEKAAAAQHHPAKATQILHIFCPGAASHVDLWDHKPALEKFHGTPLPGEEKLVSFQGKNGNLMKSPWDFVPAGKSGKRITSLLPHMAQHVDDIAFVHSLSSRTNTHGPGCIFMNTGFVKEGFPSCGAWLSYALGTANENLPAYIVMPDIRGEPPNGKANWSNGFLPARHQAVPMSAQQPIRNLSRPQNISAEADADTQGLLKLLNSGHAQEHPGQSELAARMAAYELAGRMQMAAPQVGNLAEEPAHIQKAYGVDDANPLKSAYAKNCLLARRFLEKGVRYVSLYCASRASGVDGLLNWDAHKTLKADYERHCPIFDQPTAALIADLKQRGMLSQTLVLWTTEFGRMPTHQEGTTGRDHNPDAFTCWMMGAGVKGATSYGATDDFGRRAVEKPASVYDFHATVLHLLGLDHEKLTYYYNGTNRRLTDVHGHVLKEILT